MQTQCTNLKTAKLLTPLKSESVMKDFFFFESAVRDVFQKKK